MSEPAFTIPNPATWRNKKSNRNKTLSQSFFEKLDKTVAPPAHAAHLGNCWIWLAAKCGGGYGKMTKNKKSLSAHKVSWEIHFGEVPPDKHVLHHCDVKLCCSPQHLWLGTRSDNIQDCIAKGQFGERGGEKCGQHKLSADQVEEIRRLILENKLMQREIASQFGVHQSTISNIRHGRTWC